MNTVYNASAGTGKTHQITDFYQELLLSGKVDSPRKILLMTFTENAAGELRLRVAQRLLSARNSESDTESERAGRALKQLSSAPIGTIHSYCTRLLREHALEAGLSPGFSVMDENDRTELLERICRDELLERLNNDPDFQTFCSGAQIIGQSGFGTSITETVPKLIDEAGSLGISLEHAASMLPEPEIRVTLADFELICRRIKELPKITPTVTTALKIIQNSLNETDSIESLLDKMQKLGIKKFGKGAKEISDDFWALKESAEADLLYRNRYPAARAFARYTEAVAKRFKQQKHEMDTVDFDDQLHLAAELLKSGKAQPEFDYIIVDEVQDTSRIQSDLIQALWKDNSNLVICGDKKQSIYTWRGADPQVMPDLQEMIKKSNGSIKNLKTSWRSKAPIIDLINHIFVNVYEGDEYADGDQLDPNPKFKTAGEKACIEFLEADLDEGLPKQERIEAEMEAVANRIKLLVKKGNEWCPNYRYAETFQQTGEENYYRYSDILILLRRRAHQAELEAALRHAGIPYTLEGKGHGLFTRQETRDVSLFLNVITNPHDTYSLIGFLRSPWVGLSDEAIAEMAWNEDGFSEDALKKNYPQKTDLIERYSQLLSSRLASEAIRMLINETGYDALLAGLPRGTQRVANLRKILDWIRETERGAQTTPAAVARKLAEQISHPPQIPEAALLDPAQDAVSIMTVHGSKGLTKRVVFIPDTSSKTKNDTAFARVFFDPNKNPKLGIRITATDKSKSVSPGFKAANERARAVQNHEFKNLFYVAMTRARDLVVLSSTVSGKKPDGWHTWVEPFIGNKIPAIPYSNLEKAVPQTPTFENPVVTKAQLVATLENLPSPPAKPKTERIPATKLAKEGEVDLSFPPNKNRSENATALGSLGHAVLEQLALNHWEGSASEWLEQIRLEFNIKKQEALSLNTRIEQTCKLMSELTGSMKEVSPEFSFVLYQDNRLIDGSIDLLCQTKNGFMIFDYKFTESDDISVVEKYREQLNIYRQAGVKVYPDANEAKTALVIISKDGPRLVPVEF
ncbi:MAG TPA: UvrD-helicase domain-containing protein [Pontiella sp.]